jgi:alginate O-acetyltransferase complex protein AlgJ
VTVRKIADLCLICLLIGATCLPLAGTFLGKYTQATNDMRQLFPLPELRLKGSVLKEFPKAFDRYWSDHFGYRGALIGCLNLVKVQWLRSSTSPFVLVGQGPWLFYTPWEVGHDYDGVRPFRFDELKKWQQVLEERQDWLARRGCRYLLFIPPDKQTIYPEHVEPTFRPLHSVSRLDQLVAHLRAYSTVPVVDVRQPLLEAKERERVYHITDAHWNDRGAYIGYQYLTAALAHWFPNIQPLPRSAFQEATHEQNGGDLATMVDLARVRHEIWLDLLPLSSRRAHRLEEGVIRPRKAEFPLGKPFATECDDPRLPRALMFHDSFSLALQPFLSEHFRRIAYIWHDDFHPDAVEAELPEVVIQQLLERKLSFVKPKTIEEMCRDEKTNETP